MATVTIDDSLVDTITDLAPMEVEGRKHFGDGLQSIVLQALMRKGVPDPQTGALARSYLIEGVLLRDTIERPERGIDGEYRIAMASVDVRSLSQVNDRLGMDGGERLLVTVVDALRAFAPERPVIRLHGDAFAALFPPPSPHALGDESAAQIESSLVGLARERVPELAEHGLAAAFTVGVVELVIVRPFHWRLLGPLVWAEAERAHVAARLGGAGGLMRRRIALDGYIG